MTQRRIELIGEGIARSAGAVALWTTALDHEIIDYAVEIQAFIEVFARIFHVQFAFDKAHEVCNGHGNLLVFKT